MPVPMAGSRSKASTWLNLRPSRQHTRLELVSGCPDSLARSLARRCLDPPSLPTGSVTRVCIEQYIHIVCPRHKAYTDRWPQALSGLAVAPPAQINNSIDSIRSNASHYVASRQRQRPSRIVDQKKMQITPICRLFLILNSFPLSAVRRLTLAACSKDLNTRGKRLLS